MATPWSRLEVEATVADYFEMLELELRGDSYNKTAHRRQLVAKLHNRSEGAVERKHQNISAILIEQGFVYVPGYKPLGNYQSLLQDVVVERLRSDADLSSVALEQVSAEAKIPEVEDILASMVEPPTPLKASSEVRDQPTVSQKRNYLEMEARNRSLGSAGEEFVVRFEMARLSFAGRDNLAARVERVSETVGDGLGFDVLSFEENGSERLIEVKTTAYGASTPFFVTRNEVAVSHQRANQYRLYRAYGFRSSPKLFQKAGALERSFLLEASQYRATIAP